MNGRLMLAVAFAAVGVFQSGSLGNLLEAAEKGNVTLQSAGPIAFTHDGVLLIGDAKAATLFAVTTGDTVGAKGHHHPAVKNIDAAIADVLGASPGSISINDLAVNPKSGIVYLSVNKTQGQKTSTHIARVMPDGKVEPFSLESVEFKSIALPNPPEDKVVTQGRRQRNPRMDSITDVAYFDGKVIVSGLSASTSPSTVYATEYPFAKSPTGVSLEIYHGAHGRSEDYAAARAFVPFVIDGEPHLIAGFTCTPLVKFPLKSLAAGQKVTGTTVAELGNRNRPLDIVTYKKQGKDYLLIANSARGVMKVSTANIDRAEGIDAPVRRGGTAGQAYETISELKGVVQLDRLDDQHAIVITRSKDGGTHLKTIDLP